MTTLPVTGYFTDAARTNGEAKIGFDDLRNVIAELPGGAAETELTIAAGSVTPTGALHSIDTEADAPADDLTHIAQTNVPDGRLLLIHAINPAHVVTAKHNGVGAGQMLLNDSADFALDDPKKSLLLIRRGTNWEEVTRDFGADRAAARTHIATPFHATSAKTAAFVLAAGDDGKTFLCDASGGAFTVTGLAAATAGDGYTFALKKTDSSANAITFDPDGAETVDGTANLVIGKENEVTVFECDGSNWHVVAKSPEALVVPLPRGYLSGIKTSNNSTDAVNDLDIAVGKCRDDADTANLVVASAIGKQIDVTWAAGGTPGAASGGMSSSLFGTSHPVNDTWYAVILGLVSGTEEVGFDTSETGANLVTDHSFTNTRRIGWVRRGTATNLLFVQTGDRFDWDATVSDFSGTNSTSATSQTVTAAPDTEAILRLSFDSGSIAAVLSNLVTALDVADEAPSSTNAHTHTSGATVGIRTDGNEIRVRVDGSSQVRRRTQSAIGTLTIRTVGHIDRRGRDG